MLRSDRSRILFQDAPAVLGMRVMEILLESGFSERLAHLQNLMARRRLRAADPPALAHLLNGATIHLAFWAAEGESGEGRLEKAHATLTVVMEELMRALRSPGHRREAFCDRPGVVNLQLTAP